MKKLKWYFKNGTKFEEYTVLYEDEQFMLVQNDKTKKCSFGLTSDFGTLFGFPVNQSVLTVKECENRLNTFIKIDKKYLKSLGEIAENRIKRYQNMIKALQAAK